MIGQIGETCTRESRSADVFLYKRDMYTSRAAQTSQGKPNADFMKFIILIYDFRKIGITPTLHAEGLIVFAGIHPVVTT